jgi:hypothetical protein
VDARGTITTVAGTGKPGYSGDGDDARKATFKGPKGVRCDYKGNIYVVETENQCVRRIDAKTNVVTTVAGGRKGGQGEPHGCAIDERGNIYIADSENHRVRKVSVK